MKMWKKDLQAKFFLRKRKERLFQNWIWNQSEIQIQARYGKTSERIKKTNLLILILTRKHCWRRFMRNIQDQERSQKRKEESRDREKLITLEANCLTLTILDLPIKSKGLWVLDYTTIKMINLFIFQN